MGGRYIVGACCVGMVPLDKYFTETECCTKWITLRRHLSKLMKQVG